MTNPIGTQWETALLNKITNNGERIAVVERDVKEIKEISMGLDKRLTNVEARLTGLDKRLTGVDKRLTEIESLLGWLKIIAGGVITIALSLIANFIYSLLTA